jgi:hypothetical protein
MTIQASGQNLYLGNIAQEYGVPLTNAYLGAFYRGSGTGYVKANGSGNSGVNGSASVPADYHNLNIGHFWGQAAGYTYTHTGSRITAGDHIWMHTYFGVDWNGNTWAKTFVNNGGLFSNSVNYYPFVIYQGAGIITFINNGDVQAAGGVGAVYGSSHATSGQHCLVITASNAKPRIYNNTYLAGGGGGGGWGGAGGGGGQGYYVYTAQEGPIYDGSSRVAQQPSWQSQTHNGGTVNNSGQEHFYWGGGDVSGGVNPNTTAVTSGGITYYRGTLRLNGGGGGSYSYFEIYRQFAANAYTGGGGGGIGGNGGRGIGYNTPNTGGSGGAGGGAPGTNAGWGGTGGTGGTGGSWGGVGNTGNTGGAGGGGNYTGGGAGAGGSGGGGNGAAIYSDCAWSLYVGGTLYGSYVGTAPS